MKGSVLKFLCILLLLCQGTAIGVFGKKPKTSSQDTEVETEAVKALTGALLQKEVISKLPAYGVAALLGFALDPFVEQTFNATHLKKVKGAYKETALFAITDSIDWGGKAYATCLFVDLLEKIVPQLRNLLPFSANLAQVGPNVGFAIWGARTLSSLKHMVLNKIVHTRLGKAAFFDRLIDFGLGIVTVYNVLTEMQWTMNMGIKSLFAASGASAIIFSLASKGMIEQMVAGLLIQAWDAVEVGEEVKLADGTEGTVNFIGLFETEVIASGGVPVRVPNSQIVGKRVSLIGRVKTSSVKQTLRFKYSDLDKLPRLIEDIKKEITLRCNEKLLKPPSALLTKYESDHIQVAVSCSFDIKPGSGEASVVQEQVLFAIADAVKKNAVEFALPAIQYHNNRGQEPLMS